VPTFSAGREWTVSPRTYRCSPCVAYVNSYPTSQDGHSFPVCDGRHAQAAPTVYLCWVGLATHAEHRRQLLFRDQWRSQLRCYSRNLHAHHVRSARTLEDDALENLNTPCSICHQAMHPWGRRRVEAILNGSCPIHAPEFTGLRGLSDFTNHENMGQRMSSANEKKTNPPS